LASDGPASGWFHPPFKSESIDARLSLVDGSFRVERLDGELLTTAEVTSVNVSPRVGSIHRRMTFPDAASFVTADNDAIDNLLAAARVRRGYVYRLEQFHPRLLVFTVATILLMAGLYRYGLPAFTNLAVAATPHSIAHLISNNAMKTFDLTMFDETETTEAVREELRGGFQELAAHADAGDRVFDLQFRGGGAIGPNAFALPDGTIVVTDELIALSTSRDQIYGVLAHEIAHVERQHTLHQLYRAAGFAALVMFVAGDVGNMTEDVLIQGGAMLSLSYSRGQESEADARGVDLMRAVGRDPDELANFFEILDKDCGSCDESGWWSTHPGLHERVKAIRAHADEAGAPTP
jgi:Zn-dependent protease with chaperone function